MSHTHYTAIFILTSWVLSMGLVGAVFLTEPEEPWHEAGAWSIWFLAGLVCAKLWGF